MTDNLTGLVWPKNANLPNGTKTWQQAFDYAASLNTNGGLCGYTDWRLPNFLELESLVYADSMEKTSHADSYYPYIANWLEKQGFTDVQSGYEIYYWSSSVYDSYTVDPTHAYPSVFLMSMSAGTLDRSGYIGIISYSGTHSGYVWPVRGGETAPAIIWRTGVTQKFETGDDGDLQKGVVTPHPSFTDNSDGTATDNLTGLVWLENTNCFGAKTWQASLDAANTLASGQCGLTDVSKAGDWRLPNRKELMSLMELGRALPNPFKLPEQKDSTGTWYTFKDTYWSSTTALTEGSAWKITLSTAIGENNVAYGRLTFGNMGYAEKTTSAYVFPVRDKAKK